MREWCGGFGGDVRVAAVRAGRVPDRWTEDRVDGPACASAQDGGLPVVEVGLAESALLLVQLPKLYRARAAFAEDTCQRASRL